MLNSATLILAMMLLQYGRPYPGQVRQPRGPVNPQAQSTDAVATFVGTFKSADKKFVTVEVEDGQTMRMIVTSSTKFFRDDKNVKASDFHTGDDVTVEASYDSHLNLLADRVILGKPPKPAKPLAPDESHDAAH